MNNNDQFTRKTATHQNEFLDLVSLILTTTWHIFSPQFYQQTECVAIRGPASSITIEVYMQDHKQTEKSTALHPRKS